MPLRRIVVTIRPGTSVAAVGPELVGLGLRIDRALELAGVLTGAVEPDRLDALAAHPAVEAIEDDREMRIADE